jgi:hypothetical protein
MVLSSFSFSPFMVLSRMTHSQLLARFKSESKYKTTEMRGGGTRGTLPSSQHFEGLRGVLELRDGTRKS